MLARTFTWILKYRDIYFPALLFSCLIAICNTYPEMVLTAYAPTDFNGNNTNFQGANLHTYTNESFGISVQYPEGWKIIQTDTNPQNTVTDIAIFLPTLDYFSNPDMVS